MVMNHLSRLGSKHSITNEDLQSATSSVDKIVDKIEVAVPDNRAADSIDYRKMVEKQTTRSLPHMSSGTTVKDLSSKS